MSIKLIDAVWSVGPKDPIDTSVLCYLANRAGDEGTNCYPSIALIAQCVRRSQRTVERSIAQLEADGWITVERGTGRGIFSRYVINVERLEERQLESLLAKKGRRAAALLSAEKGRLPRQKRATPTTEKGDSHDKSPTPPNRKNRQGTVKEPPSTKAKDRRAEIKVAVAQVASQCGFTSAELGNILADQIALGLERGKDVQLLAADMIASWQLYQEENHLLRYTWGPAKFFGEGQWRNQNGWPYDQERARIAREAAVGARR